MRPILWFLLGAIAVPIVLGFVGLVYLKTRANGFSARAQPTRLEELAAAKARLMALPSDAKDKRNPVPSSNEVLAAGRAHWADHCATCHGNDGKGQTEMGPHMYPPAPDMTKEATQNLTDGEIFYIIENGIRLSGMPAWGGEHGSEEDSWKLVHFIRHLPDISPDEIQEMEKLNPKSPEEWEEQQQEEQFLKGQQPVKPSTQDHHHH